MKIKELFSACDMTEGRLWERIAGVAILMLIGSIARQLYNTADSVIVGICAGIVISRSFGRWKNKMKNQI